METENKYGIDIKKLRAIKVLQDSVDQLVVDTTIDPVFKAARLAELKREINAKSIELRDNVECMIGFYDE